MRVRLRYVLGVLVALGAALRFATLGERSFWRDEIFTVELVDKSFGAMLDAIPVSEGTPPVYYVLAWGWAQVFGSGEVGIRSLSALIGTLTILVVFAAARTIASERAGLLAAALAAANPLLVWYSQEARAYALAALLVAASVWLCARAIAAEEPRRGDLGAWAAVTALAIATHYFTVFLIAPLALFLLLRTRSAGLRRTIPAVLFVAAVGLALVPLVLAQRANPGWIADTSLLRRLLQIPPQFVVGPQPSVQLLVAVALPALLGLLWLAVSRLDPPRQRRAAAVAAVGIAGVLTPIALALAGSDFFLARNVAAALIPFLIAAAIVLDSRRAPRVGLAVCAALVCLGLFVDAATADEPKFGNSDWRGAAKELGEATVNRAIVVTPFGGIVPFGFYRPDASELRRTTVAISEVVVVGLPGGGHPIGREPDPPAVPDQLALAGFRTVEVLRRPHWTIIRLRAARPRTVSRAGLAALAFERDPALFFEPSRA